MSITIELPKSTEAELRKKAKSKGQEIDEFVRGLVERELREARNNDLSWDELVAPIHAQTRRLGLSEKDVEELVDSEIAAYRREKRLKR